MEKCSRVYLVKNAGCDPDYPTEEFARAQVSTERSLLKPRSTNRCASRSIRGFLKSRRRVTLYGHCLFPNPFPGQGKHVEHWGLEEKAVTRGSTLFFWGTWWVFHVLVLSWWESALYYSFNITFLLVFLVITGTGVETSVYEDDHLKRWSSLLWNYMSHIHWVPRQNKLEIPRD